MKNQFWIIMPFTMVVLLTNCGTDRTHRDPLQSYVPETLYKFAATCPAMDFGTHNPRTDYRNRYSSGNRPAELVNQNACGDLLQELQNCGCKIHWQYVVRAKDGHCPQRDQQRVAWLETTTGEVIGVFSQGDESFIAYRDDAQTIRIAQEDENCATQEGNGTS